MFDQNDVDTYQFIRGKDLKRRETLWSTIYLDTTGGNVHVVQRWFYEFTVAPGLTPWTDDEKANFHYALTSAVGATWDSQTPLGSSSDPTVQQFLNLIQKAGNVRIAVGGAGAFAQSFSSRGLDIDFDIVLTSSHPHWHVRLHKVPPPPPTDASANVDWNARRIRLTSQENLTSQACQSGRGAPCAQGFVSSTHEFGHTLLNPDEYKPGSPSRPDLQSIMNIGTLVRPRHLSFITNQLSTMVPGCHFRAA
jgi:hypothetical protein